MTPVELMIRIEAHNDAKKDRLYHIWLQGYLNAYAFNDPKKYPKFSEMLPKKPAKPIPPTDVRSDLSSLRP
jgi:hypothetical protein